MAAPDKLTGKQTRHLRALAHSLKPIVLKEEGSWVHVFLLGWLVTVTAGLAAYPVDTIKRRMMMTVGQKVEMAP